MLGNGFIAPMQFRFPGREEGPAVTEALSSLRLMEKCLFISCL